MSEEVIYSIENSESKRPYEDTLRGLIDKIDEESLPRAEINKAAEELKNPRPKFVAHHEDGDGLTTRAIFALVRKELGVDQNDVYLPMPTGESRGYWKDKITNPTNHQDFDGDMSLVVLDSNDESLLGALEDAGVDKNKYRLKIDHHQKTNSERHVYSSGQIIPESETNMVSSSLLAWEVANKALEGRNISNELKTALDTLAIIGLVADQNHTKGSDNVIDSVIRDSGVKATFESIADSLNDMSIRPLDESKIETYGPAVDEIVSKLFTLQSETPDNVLSSVRQNEHVGSVRRIGDYYKGRILAEVLNTDGPDLIPPSESAVVIGHSEHTDYGILDVAILDEKDQLENKFGMTEAIWKPSLAELKKKRNKEKVDGVFIMGVYSGESTQQIPGLPGERSARTLDFRVGTYYNHDDDNDDLINSKSVISINPEAGGHKRRGGGRFRIVENLSEDEKEKVNAVVEKWKKIETKYDRNEENSERIYYVASLEQALDILKSRVNSEYHNPKPDRSPATKVLFGPRK